MNESLVGMRLGQFELQAPLGQGGMVTVYRALQPSLSRTVAVKVLPLNRLPDPSLPTRSIEANRIVAEVDYSFVNSSGARRYFTLRWTFVPSGNDWLADDAVASPQR